MRSTSLSQLSRLRGYLRRRIGKIARARGCPDLTGLLTAGVTTGTSQFNVPTQGGNGS